MNIKKIISALLSVSLCGFISGCNASETNNESSVSELADVPTGFTAEYELAEFEKYNSYAKDNGLANTLIYVEGTLGKLNMTNNGEFDFYQTTLEDSNGNNWLIFYDTKQFNLMKNQDALEEKYGKLENDDSVICGAYMGYSDVYKMPAIQCIKILDRVKNKTIFTGMGKSMEYSPEYDSEYLKKVEAEQGFNEEDGSEPTEEQSNAIQAANNHLESYSFSKSELTSRLETEGYSNDVAEYAVEHLNVDWNEQAVKSANNYISSLPLSRQELVEQLEWDGFTTEQAEYAATTVGK